MSDISNGNTNEGIIDPIVNKPEVITPYAENVDNFCILSTQSESSMSVTPDKEVSIKNCFNSINWNNTMWRIMEGS